MYRSVGPKVVLFIDQLILGFSVYRAVGHKVILFIDQLVIRWFCL